MNRRTAVLLLVTLAPGALCARKFHDDDPLVKEPRPRAVGKLTYRKLSDYYDTLKHTLSTPGERQGLKEGTRSGDVNTLGDPMSGAWWEPRHYWTRMTLEELKRGPGSNTPPDPEGKWRVVSAKNEGITPGFVIIDRNQRRFFVKFDPPSNPEMATAADQISSKMSYALGYHVPENYIVRFRPEMLEIGEDVTLADRAGKTHKMTRGDLSEILRHVYREPDGRYRATASLALPGKPIGPYRYYGTRADDPNDVVPHEHRRDLRGMHEAAAWLDHDDSRAINTLDIVTRGDGVDFVRHYQLDFGSTLGSASDKANSPRSGGEYLFGWKQALVEVSTLGFAVPYWARAKFPDLPSVGRFESQVFEPERWVPEYPNPAFRNRMPDDEFWMAKQIVNLTDAEIGAIVATGEYSDPRAAEWVTRCLIERRDKIGRAVFSKLLPLDRFRVTAGRLEWEDIGAVSGLRKAAVTGIGWEAFDNERETGTPLTDQTTAALPPMPGDGYWMARITSKEQPAHTIRVYVRKRGGEIRVVGVERTW